MEQQPGPVNWARFNPAPLPGMVRLWTLEAMAHGAEMVSYFRWRQFPQAQEQMHAGLLRPDHTDDIGAGEARQAAADIAAIGALGAPSKTVALVFDYQADWVTGIQPQGAGFSALRLAYEFYSAARKLGLNVDIVAPGAALDDYAMVLVPCLPIVSSQLADALKAFKGPVLIGPRTGSKTASFAIPSELPPGPIQSLIPLKIVRAESLRNDVVEAGEGFVIRHWLEHVETDLQPDLRLSNGRGIVYYHANVGYVAGWPDQQLLALLIAKMADKARVDTLQLPEGIRMRKAGKISFGFNYSAEPRTVPVPAGTSFIIGQAHLQAAGVAVWWN